MPQQFYIDQAKKEDLPRIMEIYAYARNFMKETGNPNQWKDSFPPRLLLEEDIRRGNLYLVKEGSDIHAVFFFFIGPDPTYEKIEEGSWLSDTEYGTIHRVAGDGSVHGLFSMIADFCSQRIKHLRIDTHEDNQVMQRLIRRKGFRKCGIIRVEDGSPRIAYEKTN